MEGSGHSSHNNNNKSHNLSDNVTRHHYYRNLVQLVYTPVTPLNRRATRHNWHFLLSATLRCCILSFWFLWGVAPPLSSAATRHFRDGPSGSSDSSICKLGARKSASRQTHRVVFWFLLFPAILPLWQDFSASRW